jgi:hypothetical protein
VHVDDEHAVVERPRAAREHAGERQLREERQVVAARRLEQRGVRKAEPAAELARALGGARAAARIRAGERASGREALGETRLYSDDLELIPVPRAARSG